MYIDADKPPVCKYVFDGLSIGYHHILCWPTCLLIYISLVNLQNMGWSIFNFNLLYHMYNHLAVMIRFCEHLLSWYY